MKIGFWIVAAVVVLIAVLVVVNALSPEATVEVVSPKTATVREYVEEQAVTELPHDYLVSMPIAGWLQPITLREGDAVKKDDIVARLETDDLRDQVKQIEQRIGVLETQIEEVNDHRLEQHALVEVNATVKAIDETVHAAEAKLGASKALVEFTGSELERVRTLHESDQAAPQELSRAEMEYRRADAEYRGDALDLAALKTLAAVSYVGPKFITDYIDRKSFTRDQRIKELEQVRTQREIEQRNLARAQIKSPVDGVVLARHQTRRQFLAAGTPLLTIGRLEDIEVIAEVLTERATRISVNDPVEIFGQALPDGPVPGTVLRIYPAGFTKVSSLGVEQQRVKVAIAMDRAASAGAAKLGIGFRVQVRIIHDQVDNVLTVPRNCLFRGDDGGWNVQVVDSGRMAYRSVHVGLMNDDRVQITDGLSADDTVVARPGHEIKIGARVDTVSR